MSKKSKLMIGGSPITITFNRNIGDNYTLVVDNSDTIEAIKERIKTKYGMPENLQRFIYKGKLLSNEYTLNDYNIHSDVVIDLVQLPSLVQKSNNNNIMKGGMNIFIKSLDNSEITLEVESSDTIEAIKERINSKTGVPESIQRLIYNGKQLDDGRTLAEYGIKPNTVIRLVLRLRSAVGTDNNMEGGMNIFIKSLDNSEITLEVESSDTIEAIKERINSKTGVPESIQRLIYNGKQLDDSRTLAEYGIKPNTEIRLVLRLHSPVETNNMEGGMKINIRNVDEIIDIEIDNLEGTNILEVKQAIERKYRYPVINQILHYKGRILRDDYVLSEYINQNEAINLTLINRSE